MSNKEDLLEQGFELADDNKEETRVSTAPVKEMAASVLPASMSLLRRIPVTLTLEVASVEVMLADLLNMDDDTVIELDKLAGEPLDIKVNNILLGKAEVVVINEKYGLRVLEFNSRDINELTR
ncbi:flagellar motor switch protein FliN [Atlantibacter subterraneus]|uniref:flagellar motor switch protein FliN n=1 Tax=Atlantibacter subterraneus TaxID=255519 RepID=UPI0028A90949|nr:flagellar motor switch protein FliN [Atlantibacter subterranea]